MQKRAGSPRAPRDLFGEIPVTWDEVYQWVFAVARIPADSWRARYYIEHWNIPDKIREAKLAGTFDAIVSRSDLRLPPALRPPLSKALAAIPRTRSRVTSKK